MGTMKGIYKGFKYISNIFVVKEKEMEIGTPTDVKHVAHIGWDGQSTSAPSWMGDFKGTADPTGTTISNGGGTRDPNGAAWSSQDYDDSIECQPASELFKDTTTSDIPKGPKKQKRKKPKNSNSPRSSKSTRALKTKASTCGTAVTQAEQIPIQHELTPH